jgi:hypothetical protein
LRLEVYRDGSWTRLDEGHRIHGAASRGTDLYLAGPTALYFEDAGSAVAIGDASGGEINAVAEFQGQIYVGGSFTAIDGIPSSFIGAYSP